MALSAGQAFIFGGLTLITLMNLVLVLLIGQIFIKLGHSLKHWNVLFFRTFTNTRSTERNTTQEQVVKWVADTMYLMTNQKTQDRALLRVIWAIPRKPGVSLVSLLTIVDNNNDNTNNKLLFDLLYLFTSLFYLFFPCVPTDWVNFKINELLLASCSVYSHWNSRIVM